MNGELRKSAARKAAHDLSTLLPTQSASNRETRPSPPESGSVRIAATIINGMRPQTIGRTLGIGLRVAGRLAGQRLATGAQATAAQGVAGATTPGVGTTPAAPTAVPPRPAAAPARAVTRIPTRAGLAQGVGGFLRPFRRVGGILWLEVTGVFFLLPVLAFAPTIWRTHLSYAHGPDHRTFWVSVLVVTVFLYLGVSSFWRARRK